MLYPGNLSRGLRVLLKKNSGNHQRRCRKGAKLTLILSNVTKKFGELIAVNDLSFGVEKGSIFGIAGPNGAGKSTVFNLITGFYAYQGRIEFEGENLAGMPPHKIARTGIARTFQIPRIFKSLTVEKAISVGSRFGTRDGLDPDHVEEVLQFVGLSEEKPVKTGRLNLLGKKKLMIGAALATKPKILMLDEPMAGSNAREIKTLMQLIRRINEEIGLTIIIIEHFMKVLTELTEKLLIIESGAMICCDAPDVATGNPRVIESYIGDTYAEGN
jgi:branched-chain amino acid transport system ATP-binding protein